MLALRLRCSRARVLAIFQVSRQQREAFALALGDGSGGEDAIGDFHFVMEMQLFEIDFRLLIVLSKRIRKKQEFCARATDGHKSGAQCFHRFLQPRFKSEVLGRALEPSAWRIS